MPRPRSAPELHMRRAQSNVPVGVSLVAVQELLRQIVRKGLYFPGETRFWPHRSQRIGEVILGQRLRAATISGVPPAVAYRSLPAFGSRLTFWVIGATFENGDVLFPTVTVTVMGLLKA